MATLAHIVVQVVAGVLVVYAVYRLSLWVLKKDRLVVDARNNFDPRLETTIVDGYAPTDLLADRTFDTINPRARSFKSLQRSFNRKGGAQYSYSFWIHLKDTSSKNVANKVILMRGDRQRYTFTRKPSLVVTANDPDSKILKAGEDTTQYAFNEVLVKGPLIRFGEDYKSLVVEFNTLDNPNEKVEIRSFDSASDDPGLRHNVLKLIDNAWVLFTFTFEDSVAINDFEDGIIVRFYVNDFLYNVSKVRSTLYQNNGSFYLLPTWNGQGGAGGMPLRDARIANLKYFNYALSSPAVKELYEAGPPKHYASDLVGSDDLGDPLYLSMYNKLDIANS